MEQKKWFQFLSGDRSEAYAMIVNYFQSFFTITEHKHIVSRSKIIQTVCNHIPSITDDLLEGDLQTAIRKMGSFSKNIAECAVLYLKNQLKILVPVKEDIEVLNYNCTQ